MKMRNKCNGKIGGLEEESGRLSRTGRILIVEDNVVNQKVAAHTVEKLGFRADVVTNGVGALEAMERVPYTIVLMDCQMPEMDGFAATAEIRRREGLERHTPVIAVTANVMPGERERCLAAGMDDYLPKPIRHEGLAAMIERWLPRRETMPQQNGTASRGEAPPVGDVDRDEPSVRERLAEFERECGAEMLAELIALYLDDTAQRLSRLRRLIVEQADARSLEQEAHSLKGGCANFGAQRMAELCQRMESLAEAGSVKGADALLTGMDEEFQHLRRTLEQAKEQIVVRS